MSLQRLLLLILTLAAIAGALAVYLHARYAGAPTVASPGASGGRLKPSSIEITLRVPGNGSVIEYVELDYYNASMYSRIEEGWNTYSKAVLNRVIAIYERYGARIVNASIERVDENRAVRISFVVTNAVWVSDGETTADFLWFLNAWRLDFIDSHFNEYPNGLAWSGLINGTLTTVRVVVPAQPGPYKAWGSPYGHCHGHIWWP